MSKSKHRAIFYFGWLRQEKLEVGSYWGWGAYKWEGGTSKQQFKVFLFTESKLVYELYLPVLCWGVRGILYSFLLQKPTEVKRAVGIFK